MPNSVPDFIHPMTFIQWTGTNLEDVLAFTAPFGSYANGKIAICWKLPPSPLRIKPKFTCIICSPNHWIVKDDQGKFSVTEEKPS